MQVPAPSPESRLTMSLDSPDGKTMGIENPFRARGPDWSPLPETKHPFPKINHGERVRVRAKVF
jgi:hypothetical protein